MDALNTICHFDATENAELHYEDTTLADFLSTEVTIDEALDWVYNAYHCVEPEMIYEEFGSYQEVYNQYIETLAAIIVDGIEYNGYALYYDQNITFAE